MEEHAKHWAGPSRPPANFQVLADRHALEQLAKIYALGMDMRDYALARSAFGPNATAQGREGPEPIDVSLSRTYALVESFHSTQHVIANQYVQLDGDYATVWSYGIGHHKVKPGEQRDELIAGVRYQDRCERTAGGWLIIDRRVAPQWVDMVPPRGAPIPG